ncbi:hypothetical protein D3C86_1663900 [compost metagenome]
MFEFIATHHVNRAAGLIGQISEVQVVDVGCLNGNRHGSRQGLQPLLNGCFGVGNFFKQIVISLINHQFVLGDVHTHDRF